MGRMYDTAALVAADETRKASKRSNGLLRQIAEQQGRSGPDGRTHELLAAILSEQKRTNELLAYMADLAFKQAEAAARP